MVTVSLFVVADDQGASGGSKDFIQMRREGLWMLV